MIRRVLKLLGSVRFTLFLILSLSIIFLLGLWIPQKGLLKRDLYLQWKAGSPVLVSFLETIGLTDIYTSPITLTLWVLFFLNLSLVMGQRVSIIKKKISSPENKIEDPVTVQGYSHKLSTEFSARQRADSLPEIFIKQGYRFYGTLERFYAVKNRLSPVATLLFHLSFFLILLGGVVTVYTRFAGYVDLAEGEPFRGELERYNASPRIPKIGTTPDVNFVIESIMPEVEQGTPTGLKITIVNGKGMRHVVEVNHPYKTDHTSFVIQNLGVAPLFILQDTKGNELDGAYVKLNVLRGRQDEFAMYGLDFTADFFPDYFIQDGIEGTRSEEVKNPVFRLYVQKDRRFVARRTIGPGAAVRFGDYRLLFVEMPYWVRFYVVKEYGLGIVYTGFGIATIALIWRLIFYRREIVGSMREKDGAPVLYLAGRAEFYKALFQDEFERLRQGVARAMKMREMPFQKEKA